MKFNSVLILLNILFLILCVLNINAIKQANKPKPGKGTVLPTECGQNNVNRIVGGTVAKPHSWPWAVAVYEKPYWATSLDSASFICGASIINELYVVCAAHCVSSGGVVSPATNYKLLLGAHDRTNSGTFVPVSAVMVHPKYNESNMQYDISMFQLATPLDFSAANNTMAPVCMANEPKNDAATTDAAVVIGWGTTRSNGDISNVLMQVSVPVISQKVCTDSYDNESISEKNVCAGFKEGKKDSCQGDSGGPLTVRRDNRWYQVGITSWGRGCAEKESYGVYTRVWSHINWVQETIAKKAQKPQKPKNPKNPKHPKKPKHPRNPKQPKYPMQPKYPIRYKKPTQPIQPKQPESPKTAKLPEINKPH